MTTYSLRQPFTLEDAKALIGKTADITYEPNEGETDFQVNATVASVYEIPGTERGYLEVTFGAPDLMYVPFGDVRAVENIRDQEG